MKVFGLSFMVIAHFLVQKLTAQYWNIGPLPADWYVPKDCDQPIEESVPEFLEACSFSMVVYCIANMSTPYMFWKKCIEDVYLISLAPESCMIYEGSYEKCNETFNDPGEIIYEPLYHPNEKIRIYPEIFDKIRNFSRNYMKSYVNVLTKTFSGSYASQYNYQWNKTEQTDETDGTDESD